MNKEQLKEIKRARKTISDEKSFQKKCIFLYSFDELGYLDWLIEQAEKAEKYREALKFYADRNHYSDRLYDYKIILLDDGEKARKALEGIFLNEHR